MQPFIGYGFLDKNLINVIDRIDELKFDNYSRIVDNLRVVQSLYAAFRNVKIQAEIIRNITTQFDSSKLEFSDISPITQSAVTAYILMHRMFVDNCKSFQRTHTKVDFSKIIMEIQNTNSEKVIKVLRDYAMHTALPMDQIRLTRNLSTFHSELSVSLNIQRMDQRYLSKNNKSILDKWNEESINVTRVIDNAWNNLKSFSKKIFLNYIDKALNDDLKEFVVTDRKRWEDKLFHVKTSGVAFQNKQGVQNNYSMDSGALEYFIKIILDLL